MGCGADEDEFKCCFKDKMKTTQQTENDLSSSLVYLVSFYYVFGGLLALLAICFTGTTVSGIFMSPAELASYGWMGFAYSHNYVWLSLLLGAWAYTIASFSAGYWIWKRKHYKRCIVIAVALCPLGPFGMAIGVWTIVVISRSSVREQYSGIPPRITTPPSPPR